jgi:hypothetical protein
MNRDDLANLAQKLGTPVDFDGLVKAGVLRRKGKYTFEPHVETLTLLPYFGERV